MADADKTVEETATTEQTEEPDGTVTSSTEETKTVETADGEE